MSESTATLESAIRAAAEGDRAAFEVLIQPELPILYSYIRRKLNRGGAPPEADDVFQETLLAIWRGLGGFGGRSELRAWMLGIARRKVADYYRRAYSVGAWEDIDAMEERLADEGEVGEELERRETKALVQSAVGRLDSIERELVFLVFSARLGYREVAELMGMPLGTVKSRMFAVRGKLRRILEEGGDPFEH